MTRKLRKNHHSFKLGGIDLREMLNKIPGFSNHPAYDQIRNLDYYNFDYTK